VHPYSLNMDNVIFKKRFHELNVDELYQILDLRSKVFVLEQHCLYADIDFKDEMSVHYWMKDEHKIIAYLRLIPPGIRFKEHAISRVVTDSKYRHQGLAKKLIQQALDDIHGHPVRISGQAYLKHYYETFGFHVVSDLYLEDDIPHYEMLNPNDHSS